jgi:hypothetical protein
MTYAHARALHICRPTPAFSRWLKETTSIGRTRNFPHQDAKIAPIQPVGWNAMLDASGVCGGPNQPRNDATAVWEVAWSV